MLSADVLSEILGPDVDYALEISGGRIVSTLDTPTYGYQYISLSLFGIELFTFGAKSPYVTIQVSIFRSDACFIKYLSSQQTLTNGVMCTYMELVISNIQTNKQRSK